MQYVLGLGILCKKYKKNPIIRVFADDTFIDEFEIAHDDETKKFTDISKNLQLGKNHTAKHFHLSYIDERHLNSKISIHVQNDDSNYTNGFMSKSTVISFNSTFLIPKHYLDNNCKFYSEAYDKWHKFKWKVVCESYNLPYDLIAYNYPPKGIKLGKGGKILSPLPKGVRMKSAQEIMKEQNIKKRAVYWPMVWTGIWNKKSIRNLEFTWLGGSGICDLYIKKYHGIRMFANDFIGPHSGTPSDLNLEEENNGVGGYLFTDEAPAPIPSIFNLDSKKEDNIYGINLTARFLHISYLLFKNKYAERYYS